MILSGQCLGSVSPLSGHNKITEPTMRFRALDISHIANSISKCKRFPKALLDTRYNLVNKKDVILLLHGSGTTLTNNEIKGH